MLFHKATKHVIVDLVFDKTKPKRELSIVVALITQDVKIYGTSMKWTHWRRERLRSCKKREGMQKAEGT